MSERPTDLRIKTQGKNRKYKSILGNSKLTQLTHFSEPMPLVIEAEREASEDRPNSQLEKAFMAVVDEQPSLNDSNQDMRYERYVNQLMQDDGTAPANESFQDYMDEEDEESEEEGEGEDFEEQDDSGTDAQEISGVDMHMGNSLPVIESSPSKL